MTVTPCLSGTGEPVRTPVVGESVRTFIAMPPIPKLDWYPERIAKLKKSIRKLRARWMGFDEIAEILEIPVEMAEKIDDGTMDRVMGDYRNNKAFTFLLVSARETHLKIEVVDQTNPLKEVPIGIYHYEVKRLLHQPRYAEMVKEPLQFAPHTTLTMQLKLRVLKADSKQEGMAAVRSSASGW